MNRVIGSKGVALMECVNPKRNKWRVRWDVQESEDGTTAEYMEEEFDHRPTKEEVRQLLVAWYNEQTDRAILEDFEWEGWPVWLSQTNQQNYQSSYNLAKQTAERNLPVTFKFGTDENPHYHTFESVEELEEFYLAEDAHIKAAISAGWAKKDAIDLTAYE